jgi:hypothetical protein
MSAPRPPTPKWYDAIDKDHNGKLTVTELQAALQLGGLNFSLATVAHIIRWAGGLVIVWLVVESGGLLLVLEQRLAVQVRA